MNRDEVQTLLARTTKGTQIRNMMLHPKHGMRKLPKGRVRRAWLTLRGWEMYGA